MTIRDVPELLAALQADPERRYVTAELYGGPAYAVYELPEDQNRQHPRLIDAIAADGPAFALLAEAKLYGTSLTPTQRDRLTIRYHLGDVFTLAPVPTSTAKPL